MKLYLAGFKAPERYGTYDMKRRLLNYHEIEKDLFGARKIFNKITESDESVLRKRRAEKSKKD